MLHMKIVFAIVAIISGLLGGTAWAGVGWDRDDFIVAGYWSDRVAVYDSDFTFKGYLGTRLNGVLGLDFDRDGNLVVLSYHGHEGRLYNSKGRLLSTFSNDDLGSPRDVKVGPNGNYFIGTENVRNTPTGLIEFSPSGKTVRQFASGDYRSVAVLPGNVLWGGTAYGGTELNVFDIVTGEQTGSIPLDNGQLVATSMSYSAATDTVLITDWNVGAVFERRTDGSFVRSFDATGIRSPQGVTRGPRGDVFATDYGNDMVWRWTADGTFLGTIDVSTTADGPGNILWTGNIPAPGALVLFGIAGLFHRHRRRHRAG